MSKSRHFQARLSQRAIKSELVEITQRFGIQKEDKIFLNKQGLKNLLQELQSMEKAANELLKKGGVVVVESEGTLVTGYRIDSFKRNES